MISERRISLNIWLEDYHAVAYEVEEILDGHNKNQGTDYCLKLAKKK